MIWAGCDGNSGPVLESAVFLDDRRADGVLGEGETIVLTFSKPVELTAPERTGVQLEPSSLSLGFYEITDRPEGVTLTSRQLAVVLRREEREIRTSGIYSVDRDAVGLRLDYGRVSITNAAGEPLTSVSRTVDLASTPPRPNRLTSAEWIDVDRTQSVSRGDILRFDWEGPVRLSDEAKRLGGEVPEDLLVLPVEGDRLDDGEERSRLRSTETQIEIQLGSRPRLTPFGVYDGSAPETPGSSSGIAFLGTSIRPSRWLLDQLGQGVADRVALDLAGEVHPFFPEALPESLATETEDATVTSLFLDRVLVAGGTVYGGIGGRRVTNEAAILRLEPGGTLQWTSVPLTSPRTGHTTTFFPGWDGLPGTDDDFVAVHGGFDDTNQPLDTIEVLRPNDPSPRFRAVRIETDPSFDRALLRRAHHTAHPFPARSSLGTDAGDRAGRLLLVGGFGTNSTFNGHLTIAEFSRDLSHVRMLALGFLTHPRAHHRSVLLAGNGPLSLFVYGGYGTSGRPDSSAQFAGTIDAPELFLITERVDDSASPDHAPQFDSDAIEVPRDAIPAGPRFGHRLVVLNEEVAPILLLGGDAENPYRRQPPRLPLEEEPDYAQCYRIEIDVSRRDRPLLSKRAGRLLTPRSDAETLLLADGSVLVIGGREPGETEASRRVERFEPDWDFFEYFGQQLNWGRSRFGAAPINETDWLLVGGARERDSGAEIFRAAY